MADDKQERFQEDLSADVPTYYANSVSLGISPYDLTLVFGVRAGNQVKALIRMITSLEHAVVMTMVLRRSLREHTKMTGIEPKVPIEVMRDLQLDEEEPLW